ncbi:MAG: metallophosphoesterase [Lachnospiraceae bacterium]|nr:metallophosphoesterase [Lachnospiraceae bacterium]
MKVLVIPDVHLKPYIFYSAAEIMRLGIADRAVCLMDIPDDWKKQFDIELYARTYDAAIEFAKEYPSTVFCYGNHDLCYLWGERESGYSPLAGYTVKSKLMELNSVLPDNNPIKYIARIDNVIFCHGGISKYFVLKYVKSSRYDDVDAVIETINGLGQYEMWVEDSPIWLRPQHCKTPMYKPRKLLQVVGHTPVGKIERKGNIISSDVFSTYRDGQPIGTQEFLLLDTKTWEYSGIRI